jgi:hypothetical protein
MISAAGTAPAHQSHDDFNIIYTRFISKKPCTKEYSKADDGTIQKKPALPSAAGIFERVETPFYPGFYNELINADSHTAMIFGVFSSPRDMMYAISKSDKAKHPGNAAEIARTKFYFSYANARGLLMFDRDPSQYGQDMTPADFIRVLGELYPPILQAARIVRGSCSAGVHLAGKPPKSSKGFHVYVPVLDASDIPRFTSVLADLAWIAGHGFVALAKNGAMLDRTFFDTAVYSPERLDYVGKPLIVGDGLEYTAPAAEYTPGAVLDTRGLL